MNDWQSDIFRKGTGDPFTPVRILRQRVCFCTAGLVLRARFVLGLAILLAFLLSGTALAAPSSQEQAELQALYKQRCAMCHGPDGKGNTPMAKKLNIPDLLSPTSQKKTDAELTQVIENGKNKMPAFKAKLQPEQIKDLVAFIRELSKPGSAAHK